MSNRRSRWGRFAVICIGALALLLLVAYADAPLTARTYFWLENKWSEHWPIKSQKGAFRYIEPAMRKIRILRPARIEVEPGISFYLDSRDLISRVILVTGQWQPEIWESLAPSLGEGGVFLDVGAHIGYYSIKAARKVGSSGHVVSFEPNPETLKLLRDNVSTNHTSNVIVEPIACTDRDLMLTFYAVPTGNTGASSLARDNAEPWAQTHSYQVHGRPIDDVVRELNLSRVDAMKIDVEGAEVSVLRGAIDTLKRFHPKVVIEVSAPQLATFQTTPADVVALIKSAGYDHGRPLNEEQEDWEWTVGDAHGQSGATSGDSESLAKLFIRGVYDGPGSARWTDANFALGLARPDGAEKNGAWLSLKLYISGAAIKVYKAITLSARIGGVTLTPQTYTTDGVYEYRRPVPASALNKKTVEVDFSVDKFLTMNGKNMGVLVMGAALQPRL